MLTFERFFQVGHTCGAARFAMEVWKMAADAAAENMRGLRDLDAESAQRLLQGGNEEESLLIKVEGVSLTTQEEQQEGQVLRGKGTLIATVERVAWITEDSTEAVWVGYEDMIMHAICKDEAVSEVPCIYCQIDCGSNVVGDDDDEGEGENTPFMELKFIPETESQVQEIFEAFSEGIALHPGPVDEDEPEMGGFGFSLNGLDLEAEDEGGLEPEEQQRRLDMWDSLLVTNSTGQFEDAEDTPLEMSFQEPNEIPPMESSDEEEPK